MRRFRKFLPAAANTANTELSGCFWAPAGFPVVFKQQTLLAFCRFQATVQMKKHFCAAANSIRDTAMIFSCTV